MTLKAFLERLNISLAEYEWLRNQMDEPKKIKKSRHLLNKVQEDNFDPYKEIANNRKQFKNDGSLLSGIEFTDVLGNRRGVAIRVFKI